MTSTKTGQPRLDPRDPLVLDTRELGRRPGSMRRASLTVPAPAELGTPVAGVAVGTDVVLDLRLESVMEGVLVSGTASTVITGECSRCLDEFTLPVEVEIQELYVYPGARDAAAEDDEDELPEVVGDFLDLEPTLRDALVLSLPLSPLCRPDCQGLCVDCGATLDEAGPDHAHRTTDPRWAALTALTDDEEKD